LAEITSSTDDLFNYIKSLPQNDKDFAMRYFDRVVARQEIIQTEQKDGFSDAFNPKKV
jgi:hypothetical protein